MTAENVTYYAFYEPIVVTPPSEFPTVPVIIVSVFILLIAGGAVWFFILRRRKENEPIPVTPTDAPVPSAVSTVTAKIVKTRYTDEEIDRVIQDTKEVQKLTDRELDVFRELLKGKKQSEISYYLGITVNTVKEYTRKVYSRLGVSNKEELFELIDSKLRRDL